MSKNGRTVWSSVGGQITLARPSSPTNRLTVTTILTTSEVPSIPRMITRSISAPNNGASTNTTSTIAGSVGTPHATWTCQYANAAIIENAPWAKLKTPEVV